MTRLRETKVFGSGEVWLQASWRVEDRETTAAPYIRDECVVPCYYRANKVLPGYMLVAMTWAICSIHERKNLL